MSLGPLLCAVRRRAAGVAGTEIITGTFGQSATSSRSIGTNGGGGHMGLQFTSTTAGTLRRVRVRTTGGGGAGTFHAELWTNASGAPGAKIGSSSNSVSIGGAAADHTFTFMTEPAISDATLYWVVLVDETGTGTPVMDSIANDANYGSGRNNTITAMTGTDLPAAEDWRFEIVQFG